MTIGVIQCATKYRDNETLISVIRHRYRALTKGTGDIPREKCKYITYRYCTTLEPMARRRQKKPAIARCRVSIHAFRQISSMPRVRVCASLPLSLSLPSRCFSGNFIPSPFPAATKFPQRYRRGKYSTHSSDIHAFAYYTFTRVHTHMYIRTPRTSTPRQTRFNENDAAGLGHHLGPSEKGLGVKITASFNKGEREI